jgi:tetratricopeptide (TPR) repeat protein
MNDPTALGSALDNRGRFLFRRGRLAEAREAHDSALEIQEQSGDTPAALRSRNALGQVCLQEGDLPAAIARFRDTIGKARPSAEPGMEGRASVNLADALLESGEPEQAREALQILAPLPDLFTTLGDPLNVGTSLHLTARAHRLLNHLEAARDAIDSAIRIAEAGGKRVWEADWLIEAAQVRLAAGDAEAAMDQCERAVALQKQLGDLGREAEALDCRAEIQLAMGNPQAAADDHEEAARKRAAQQQA